MTNQLMSELYFREVRISIIYTTACMFDSKFENVGFDTEIL